MISGPFRDMYKLNPLGGSNGGSMAHSPPLHPTGSGAQGSRCVE